MNLRVSRKTLTDNSTTGELLIDDKFFCYTLEDVVRPDGVKVQNKTAIPAGTYSVIIDVSVRFQRLMPHILNVPGFDGIRIHNGNTDADTDGCILLGFSQNVDFVGRSKEAFSQFFTVLQVALKSGTVSIEIVNNF
jgi:hypothetical protein